MVYHGLPTLRPMKSDGALEWLQLRPASFVVVLVDFERFFLSIGDGIQLVDGKWSSEVIRTFP